jgi:hypothetical protein
MKYRNDGHLLCLLLNYFACRVLSACIPGQYAAAGAGSTCIPCSKGTYSSSTDSTLCTECSAGHYTECDGLEQCSSCWGGYYQISTGASNCVPCAPGRYSDVSGSTTCRDCPIGSISGQLSRSSECRSCLSGYFSPQSVSVVCLSCPEGLTSTIGAGICNFAKAGYYIMPPGAVELALYGGWGDSSSSGELSYNSVSDNSSPTTYPCPAGAECLGGHYLPIPILGYFGRPPLAFGNRIFGTFRRFRRCFRLTCSGFVQEKLYEAKSCWEMNANLTGLKQVATHVCGRQNYFFTDVQLDYYYFYTYRNNSVWGLVDSGRYFSKILYENGNVSYGVYDSLYSKSKHLRLVCSEGSRYNMCGSCMTGYSFNRAKLVCDSCASNVSIYTSLGVLGVLLMLTLCARFCFNRRLQSIRTGVCSKMHIIIGVLNQVDEGSLRVLWTNYQVTCTLVAVTTTHSTTTNHHHRPPPPPPPPLPPPPPPHKKNW